MRLIFTILACGLFFSAQTSHGGKCTYALAPTSSSFPAAGGGASFTVTAGAGCAWAATPSTTWLHATSSGSGNGTVNYTVDPNGSAGSRSGNITVAGQVFTISQGGAPVSLGFALNNTNLVWETGPDYPWYGTNDVTHDGVASATSSNRYVPDSVSWIQTTVVGPGTIAFWWKVDSDVSPPPPLDPFSFDTLSILINGAQRDLIMGQIDWNYRAFAVPAGTNIITWQYTKDPQYNSAYDRGWLDQVTWTPGAEIPLQTALDTCGVQWTSGGTIPTYWTGETNVTHDGSSAAQSGTISFSQETWMQAGISGVTNVSFWWKVSSQTNYDFLEFYTNGVLLKRISGEVNWQSNYFNLPPVDLSLTWRYATTNGSFVAQGQNAAWVDQVKFNPGDVFPPAIIYSFTNLVLSPGPNCQTPLPDLTGTNYFLALDTCSSVTVSQSPAPGTLLSPGTNWVVLTASDTSGHSVKSTNSVVVSDLTPPLITLLGPSPLTLECHSAFVDPGATASDNCAGVVSLTTNSTVLPNTTGSYQVQYVAMDASGNSATNSRTVHVVDTTPPVVGLNGPAAMIIECHAPFSDPGATANDNCAGSVPVLPDHAINTAVLGTNTIVYLAQDGNGNSNQVARTVVVVDTTPPVFVYSFTNLVLNVASNCQVSLPDLTGTNFTLATDAASSVTVTQSPPAGTLLGLGTNLVVLTAFDTSGNTVSVTNTVVVVDTSAPLISPPADLLVATGPGQCSASAVSLGTPVTSDNCSLSSVSNNAPAAFAVGTNLVTWTAVDASGNIATSVQRVVVHDLELPTITCPASVSVSADAGQGFASAVNLGTAATSDNCGVASANNDAPAQFLLGTNLVTWTVTDIHGNQNTCIQQVIVTLAPNLPHSITGLVRNDDGTVTVNFHGTSNVQYSVQVSTNLTDWVSVQTNTAGEGGFWSYTDPDAANYPVRLYRAARP